jgi:DivIVA domain-containing protein
VLTLLLVLVALVIVGGVLVLLVRDQPVLADDAPHPPPSTWPGADAATPQALAEVGFPVVLRGYRMDEVDRVLDDAAVALAQRDARIETLLQVVATLGGEPATASQGGAGEAR